jgi:hypothetical protein
MITRIALFATLGCLLDALGLDYTSTAFWCVVALFIAQGYLAHTEGFEQATDLAQDTWQAAKQLLEQAQALKAAKGYQDED